MLRSEEMGLYTLRVAKDYAHEVMEALGWQAALHFIDPSGKAKLRVPGTFLDLVRKCAETRKILEHFEGLCKQFHIVLSDFTGSDSFIRTVRAEELFQGRHAVAYFEETEQHLQRVYDFVQSQQEKSREARESFGLLEERETMVRALARSVESVGEDRKSTNIARIALTVNKLDEMPFKRLIFRITKGNSVILAEDLFESRVKTLYVILLRGEQLKNSVMTACESYSQNV